ncbi:hypothetical protein [Palleronia abyssalis]|uniref:Uncharacterized protein n=1 Tax=Palleronia abyssalis TaxID=1501240 RepID=A0A2R8C1B2_9RHOB|nr:hypothetical protein [Palleronia abyssalis]SPJ26182.1 hypothetical protein PAA8504_04038 [Palleronia abyssalis]
MTRLSPLVAEHAAQPRLTPVHPGDPALTTTLLLNAARRGFARLATGATANAEPDWSSFLSALVEAGSLSAETLLCPGTHAAVPVLAAALPMLDRAVVSYEYGRAFAGEILTHEAAYLAHLHRAGVPARVRDTLIVRVRHEALLRDLETLVASR